MIVPLNELESNQEADTFALLSEKASAKTKDGKPFLWVTFQDSKRKVRFPIWHDLAVYKEVLHLKVGTCCKIRAVYRNTSFGNQLEIHRIRPVEKEDEKDGFNEMNLHPASHLPADKILDELQRFAALHIGKGKLLQLVTKIMKEYRMNLLTNMASRNHHHNYIGGLLEHTLSVTKIAAALVDHYHKLYPDKKEQISKPLAVAGALLHDIGKVREYEPVLGSQRHSTEGELIGHAILGRDIVRESAHEFELEPEILTRLEHIVLSHERHPDWGTVKPPMSLEAMIVHHADSCDAMLGCFWSIVSQDSLSDSELTGKKNVLGYPLLKPPAKPENPEH